MEKQEWDALLLKRRRAIGRLGYHNRLDGDPAKKAEARRELDHINAEIQRVLVASGRPA